MVHLVLSYKVWSGECLSHASLHADAAIVPRRGRAVPRCELRISLSGAPDGYAERPKEQT
jgi:hypothetical protein